MLSTPLTSAAESSAERLCIPQQATTGAEAVTGSEATTGAEANTGTEANTGAVYTSEAGATTGSSTESESNSEAGSGVSSATEGVLSHVPISVEVTVGPGSEATHVPQTVGEADERSIEEIVTLMRAGEACIDLHPSPVTDYSDIPPNQASIHLAVIDDDNRQSIDGSHYTHREHPKIDS